MGQKKTCCLQYHTEVGPLGSANTLRADLGCQWYVRS